MRLDHPRLLVREFAACFRFYRDMVGFRVTWGHEGDVYAAFSDRDGTECTLALYRREVMAEVVGTAALPGECPTPCQDRVVLAITTDDLDAAVARMESQGVQFVAGPRAYPDWGMRGAHLRDPDGNLIELIGYLPREEWSRSLEERSLKYRGR